MAAIALAFNLLVFLLACVGMMVAFNGGSGYLPVLLVLLTLSLPVSLLTTIAGFAWFARRTGVRNAPRALWTSIPQWQAVMFWLGVALVLCGEMALLVTLRLAEEPPRFWQHLPLIAGLLAAIACCVADAARCARRQ